ncbi:MAG: hypothetical protein ACREMY_09415 [bacterium]
MTARKLPAFRLSAFVWTTGLAAALAFTGLEIRAVSQTPQKPTPPASTGVQAPTAPPRAGGQGANQGGDPGRGQSRVGTSIPGQRGGSPWWKDDAIKKELALREDQVRRLDNLFETRAKNSELMNDELDKQRAELDRLMSDRTAGPAAIALQVARLEVPRAKLNESFYVMIYRMSLVLDPEQNKKLQAIFDRNRDHGRGGH